jgi:nitrilase
MRREDIGAGAGWRERVVSASAGILADGGSCVAGPDGEWVLPPAPAVETLLVATIDHRRVREERQNFDPSGHYARPDVTRLQVNRRRQSIVVLTD